MGKTLPNLIIIIPALNEEKTISTVIKHIPTQIEGVGTIKTIVIDDGSTDKTAVLARSAGAEVVRHKRTMGVGAAFHTGIRTALKAGADIIVNIDGDGQFNPADIPKLVTLINNGMADFVSATRFAKPELIPEMPAIKIWGNRWMTRIVNFITRKEFTDVSCGFRAYSRYAALKMTLFGSFTYTQETLIDLAYKNIIMSEVPLVVRGEREFGTSRVASNLWRFGLKSGSIVFRTARDYQPLYFFGVPGLVIFLLGVVAGLFLLAHYVQTGQTNPYRSLVTVSGILIIVGFLLLFMSMLADMLHRNRLLSEKVLYHVRKISYGK